LSTFLKLAAKVVQTNFLPITIIGQNDTLKENAMAKKEILTIL